MKEIKVNFYNVEFLKLQGHGITISELGKIILSKLSEGNHSFHPEIEDLNLYMADKNLKFFPNNAFLSELTAEDTISISCSKSLRPKVKQSRDYICNKYARNYENTFHLTTDTAVFKYFEIDKYSHNPFTFSKRYNYKRNDFSKLVSLRFDSKVYLEELSFTDHNLESAELVQFIYFFDERLYAKKINILAKYLLLFDTLKSNFDLFSNVCCLHVYPLTESSKIYKCDQEVANLKFLNLIDLSVNNCSYVLLNSILRTVNCLRSLKVINIYEVLDDDDESGSNMSKQVCFLNKLDKLKKLNLEFKYLDRYETMIKYLQGVSFRNNFDLLVKIDSHEFDKKFSLGNLNGLNFVGKLGSIAIDINADLTDEGFSDIICNKLTSLRLKPYSLFTDSQFTTMFNNQYPLLKSLNIKLCEIEDIQSTVVLLNKNTMLLRSASTSTIKITFASLKDYICFYTKINELTEPGTVILGAIISGDSLTDSKGLEELLISDRLTFEKLILNNIRYNRGFKIKTIKNRTFRAPKLEVNCKVAKEENVRFLNILDILCSSYKCKSLELNNIEEGNVSLYSILKTFSEMKGLSSLVLNNIFIEEKGAKLLIDLFNNNKLSSATLNKLVLDTNKNEEKLFCTALIRRNQLYKLRVMNYNDYSWRILSEELFTTENSIKLLSLYSVPNIPMIILAYSKVFKKLSLKNVKASKMLYEDVLSMNSNGLLSLTLDIDHDVLSLLFPLKFPNLLKIKILEQKRKYENPDKINFLTDCCFLRNIRKCQLAQELRYDDRIALNKIYRNIKF
jgi:hypothetical protein